MVWILPFHGCKVFEWQIVLDSDEEHLFTPDSVLEE
jgi:hypothetical protein